MGAFFNIYFGCVMVAFSVKVHGIYHVGGTLGEPKEIIHANLQRVTADGMEDCGECKMEKL